MKKQLSVSLKVIFFTWKELSEKFTELPHYRISNSICLLQSCWVEITNYLINIVPLFTSSTLSVCLHLLFLSCLRLQTIWERNHIPTFLH